MAEFSAGFKIFADASQFHREMKEAAEGAKRVQSGFRELGLNIKQYLGVGAIIAGFSRVLSSAQEIRDELKRQGKAVDEATASAARYADDWDNLKKTIGGAGIAVIGFFTRAGEGIGMLLKGGFRELMNAFKALADGDIKRVFTGFGDGYKSVAEEERKLAQTAKDLEETERRIVNEKRQRAIESEKARKADEAAMKAALATLKDEEKRAAIMEELGKLEREQARAKMDSQARLNDLRKEEKALAKQIAELEDFRKNGELLTAGAEQLLDLKKQQQAVQERITKETEATAKADVQAAEAVERKLEAMLGIAGIRTSRQFEDATPAALREAIRRNEQALFENNQRGQFAPGSGIAFALEAGRLQQEIANLRQELDFRAEISRNLSLLGQDGARRQFGGDPLSFDRIMQRFVQDDRDVAELVRKNTQVLEDFQRALRTGLPVIQLNKPPGG